MPAVRKLFPFFANMLNIRLQINIIVNRSPKQLLLLWSLRCFWTLYCAVLRGENFHVVAFVLSLNYLSIALSHVYLFMLVLRKLKYNSEGFAGRFLKWKIAFWAKLIIIWFNATFPFKLGTFNNVAKLKVDFKQFKSIFRYKDNERRSCF